MEDVKTDVPAKIGKLEKIFLMMLEYGNFKQPDGTLLAFGGALTSSYMALRRLKRAHIRLPLMFEKPLKWVVKSFLLRYRKQIELFLTYGVTATLF